MMVYTGSKRRFVKHLLPLMLSERKDGQWWVEPFVGGCNMIENVDNPRLGNDINKYIISLFKALQNGYMPPTNISKEMFLDIKNNKDKYPEELVGFVGTACTFGASWFGSYMYGSLDMVNFRQRYNHLLKQVPKLSGVVFTCGDYRDLKIPDNSLVYCDPPYRVNNVFYQCKVEHDIFWEWCRNKSREGHTVFISEYQAPEDFECIKEIEYNCAYDSVRTVKRVERLFRYRQ